MKIHELGHVVLYVSSLKTRADFYKNTLGFSELHRDAHTALFSSGRSHHELLLIEVGGQKITSPRPTPGLYHIGFKIGDNDDQLRAAIEELASASVEIIGMSDHHVTHSIYILDPDGNELELYVDIGDQWKTNPLSVVAPTKRLKL